jgi:hypothetical protein
MLNAIFDLDYSIAARMIKTIMKVKAAFINELTEKYEMKMMMQLLKKKETTSNRHILEIQWL